MKVQCNHCGKRFSGDQARFEAAKQCPRCKAGGSWWTLLASDLQSAGNPNDGVVAAGDTPFYERQPGFAAGSRDQTGNWDATASHDTTIGTEQVPESELDELRRQVAYLRAEMRVVRQSPALGQRHLTRTATKGWVQLQDALLLLILFAAVGYMNWRLGDRIERLEARWEAIEKWTEQDFLVGR